MRARGKDSECSQGQRFRQRLDPGRFGKPGAAPSARRGSHLSQNPLGEDERRRLRSNCGQITKERPRVRHRREGRERNSPGTVRVRYHAAVLCSTTSPLVMSSDIVTPRPSGPRTTDSAARKMDPPRTDPGEIQDRAEWTRGHEGATIQGLSSGCIRVSFGPLPHPQEGFPEAGQGRCARAFESRPNASTYGAFLTFPHPVSTLPGAV